MVLSRGLAARLTLVRGRHGGSRWPKEYSRKKWHLGPPPLPPEIVDWMKDLEEQKLEKLEEERDDLLPPGPRFQGSSHIGVTFLPRVEDVRVEDEFENAEPAASCSGSGSDSDSDHDPDRCSEKRMDEYIAYYRRLAKQGVVPSKSLGVKMSFQDYYYLLLQCADERTLTRGKWAHAHILSHGQGRNRYLSNYLMIMYSKCGRLKEAELVFEDVARRNVFSWTILIRAYVDAGLFQGALLLFRRMLLDQEDKPNETTMSCVLTACGRVGLEEATRVHQMIEGTPMVSRVTVGNALVSMYARCGAVQQAKSAFERIDEKNLVSWNAMVAAYARLGHYDEALECFSKMEMEGMEPDIMTFMAVLDALQGDRDYHLDMGRVVEQRMVRKVWSSLDVASDTALLNMYARCGSVGDSRRVFDEMPERDLVAWSSMVAAFAQNGQPREAIRTFRRMQIEGMKPNWITLVSLVEACSSLGDVSLARKIQDWSVSDGSTTTVLQNALLGFFGKHGNLEDVKEVFDGMLDKDSSSWNATTSALVEQGCCVEAQKLFKQMLLEGVEADKVTFLAALEACSVMEDLDTGRRVHSLAMESVAAAGDRQVQNTVVNMYAKCGSIEEARAAFDRISDKDIVSWNAMVSAVTRQQQDGSELLSRMDLEGVKPDKVTMIQLLEACCCLRQGRRVQQRAAEAGLTGNEMLDTALVDMFGKCGSIEEAKLVFLAMSARDEVAWSAMLGALVDNGDGEGALELLSLMDLEGSKPNAVALLKLLQACKISHKLEAGKMVHQRLEQDGLDVEDPAAVEMYASCGEIGVARQVFEKMPRKTLAAWNAMLAAYARSGDLDRSGAEEAAKLFRRMELEGVKPDGATLAGLVDACGTIGDQRLASKVLERLVGLDRDEVLQSLVVSMLSRCGDVEGAKAAFDDERFPRGSAAWSLMATAYAQRGRAEEALGLAAEMELEGVEPTSQVFAGLLFACSHAGMLEEGCRWYYTMTVDHGLEPGPRHRNAVVDLLARAGWLREAEVFVDDGGAPLTAMTSEDGVVAWSTLLGCSGTHGDVELAKRAAEKVSLLDPLKPATYVALSNMYACSKDTDSKSSSRARENVG